MSENKKIFYAFLILASSLLILRLPTLFELPGLDQTLFAYIGQNMQEGKLLYHDLWDHKPPGIFFLYSGLSYLSANPPWIIPLMDLLYTLLTMGALFLLAKKLWDSESALGAAFIFALFSLSPAFQGSWSRTQAETLMNLPLILCFYSGYQAHCQKKYGFWFLSGLALGMAFLIKFTALLLALPLLPLLWVYSPGFASSPKSRFLNLSLLILGLMSMTVAAGLYLYFKGVLAEAYEALWIFNRVYSSLRVNITTIPYFILKQLRGQVFFIFTLFFLAVLGWRKGKFFRSLAGQILMFWILGVLLAIYLQGKYIWYHFLSFIPPFSLAAGFSLGWLKKGTGKLFQITPIFVMVLLVLAIGDSFRGYFSNYGTGFAFLFKKANYEQALLSLPANANKLPLFYLGRYLAQNTQAKDSIYVWGIAPEIYYYAQRPAANRFIFHYYLMNAHNPLASKFPGTEKRQKEFLSNLREKPVKFFVVGVEDASVFEPHDSLNQLKDFTELDQWVQDHYFFVTRKDRYLIFQRKPLVTTK
jgi:hypothetical protein